jgi:DNA-binding transcriptional LysR family regulator
MNLTLEALRILDAIDRKGSFATAALELDRVPSALTYSVRKLEEDLDVLLFDRRGHRAKLTPAGQELLDEGRNLLRAATELEQRVKRTAAGWEAELKIVIDRTIPFVTLLPLIAEFDGTGAGTRLRFSSEVLSGVWDALVTGRADLAIGATYDAPELARISGGFLVKPLGLVEWVFAVAPSHPLADAAEPLSMELIQQHRAIAVGDTGRTLPAMTAGLLSGQQTMTVPDIAAKLAAQVAGLGCGRLPRAIAEPCLRNGTLLEKQVAGAQLQEQCYVAWRRTAARGKSLKWFINRLSEPATQQLLLRTTS